ncbi:hypothetical protein GCK72_022410 [Caenorhabditis remanei]|uniref:Uncharacterized protein n=1 Tax=Caenorhabditis remanei TaxID=31234 RepID=A0A6A5FTQ8_CAERE|nr:hypothetical protein GCK72_022410 [Caenorhabditis remanei]KAF1745962.1 hypothetical protein GCK72_022410 [Caenorhabditis remanei]
MGLNMNSDTTKYKCKQYQPRKLPVTELEDNRTQNKILEKLRRAAERERRNSEEVGVEGANETGCSATAKIGSNATPTTTIPTKICSPQCNRPPAPLNFSKSHCRHNKALRMFVEENVEALVTIKLFQICQPIVQRIAQHMPASSSNQFQHLKREDLPPQHRKQAPPPPLQVFVHQKLFEEQCSKIRKGRNWSKKSRRTSGGSEKVEDSGGITDCRRESDGMGEN